jgi:Flp pilus assembly protein TadG
MAGGRLLRRWGADRGGATAVEFAFIGPLFLLLVLASIEFGIQLMTQMDLDNATEAAARQVALGAATSNSNFVTDVCSSVSVLIPNCSSSLQVHVTAGSTFAGLSAATVQGGKLTPSSFTPGTYQSDVLVQVAYTRPYDIQWLAAMFGQTPTVLSTVAVQNEPAPSTSS